MSMVASEAQLARARIGRVPKISGGISSLSGSDRIWPRPEPKVSRRISM